MTKVFISYVRENRDVVQRLASDLAAGGLDVWLDLKDLKPGVRWKEEIRREIKSRDYFLACFSDEYYARSSTHMNEEILLAIEEARLRHTDRPWFISVLLEPCEIPNRSIGGGESLKDLQAVRLYENWKTGVISLLKTMRDDLGSPEDFMVQAQDFTCLTADRSLPALTSQILPNLKIDSQVTGGDYHAEIDDAARHISEGRPDVAVALLNKLRRSRWDVLTPRERFRVLANLGNSYLRKGDEKGAARAFLEAANFQPHDDDQALSVAAHGQLLSGNADAAYALALESCSRNSMNERAQIVRLQSAPKDLSYQELLSAVPESLRSNLSVSLSLSEIALDQDNPVEAEKILRLVKDDSPPFHFSLGVALLQQEPSARGRVKIALAVDPERVREAHRHFTTVISLQNSPPGMIAAAYFNRALASSLLGNEAQAFVDFRLAYNRDPADERFAAAFISNALLRDDNVSALIAAQEAFKNRQHPIDRLLLGTAISKAGGREDRQQILPLLQAGLSDLETESPQVRIEYLRRTIQAMFLSGVLTHETGKTLENYALGPIEMGIIRSLVFARMDCKNEARVEAKTTATLLTSVTSLDLRREMALLLSWLGLAEQAFPLWFSICTPFSFDEDTIHLLQAAERLDKDDEILEFCQRLRANSIYAPEAAQIEIELLIRYHELKTAQSLLGEYLAANPANLSLRLALLNVAVIQNWPDIVDAHLTPYPAAQELETVVDGARLVQILGFKGMIQAAAELAYELVRRFPDDPNSHRALIVTILGLGGSRRDEDLNLETPSAVEIGSAVRIRRSGESSQWVVIEDSKPEISRDEYAPDHPLAQALIGKRVGERVTLPVEFVRAPTAQIEEIKHKILFRMHQSMEQMNRRFPGKSFFEAIKIGGESVSEGHELDELLALNRKLAEGPMEAEKLYQERRIPIAAVASMAHKDIPTVIEYFAHSRRHAIHCVDGRAEEYKRTNFVISSAQAVVLDLSALSTIGLLGEDFDLARLSMTCIVSEGTLECLRQRGKSLLEDGRVGGFLNYDDEANRLIMQEIDPNLERDRAARAAQYAAKIATLCEVVGGRSLARIVPDERDTLLRMFGSETAESIAIAKEYNYPLWTDDYATGVIASESSIPRIWTQVICFWLRDSGAMSGEECDVVTARLCGFNYAFTSIWWKTILVACGLCDWDPDRQPLKGVLERFGEIGKGEDSLMIAASAIPALWRDKPLIDHATRVTIRMLEKLSHSKSGMANIQKILRSIDSIFGLNVVDAERAKLVIETWLRTGLSGGGIFKT